MPVIPVLRRVRQNNYSSLRPVWATYIVNYPSYIVNYPSLWAMNKQTKLIRKKIKFTL